MDLEQAVLELENMHTDPIPAIEFLIVEGGDAASVLLVRLAALQAGNKPPLEFAVTPPHPLLHRVQFRLPWGINSSVAKLATQRIVIALGAMRLTIAVPALLDLVARAPCDAKFGETVGWALANIGDAALLPLFSFARRRKIPPPARSLAMMTLGYITDPCVPTILNNLWREYRLEEPCLAIAALMGLTVYGLGDEACTRAVETERLWRARGRLPDPRRGVEFVSIMELLHHVSENTRATESLPAWPSVAQILGR